MVAPRNTIFQGDALEQLRTLPDGCVQTCVTSPPYWNLRDYGMPGQIGLDPRPSDYVARIVAVFDEVRRVLRSDGTLWLNMGDGYSQDTKWGGASGFRHTADKVGVYARPRARGSSGLKPKDLIGMPWRVAFALQEAGWWLRSDIIWHKSNPMPESVTDRPTKAHEYLFLLSKSERYHYDADAIRECAVADEPGDMDGGAQRLPDGSNANAGRNYRQPNSPQSIASPHGQGFTRRAIAQHKQAALRLDLT